VIGDQKRRRPASARSLPGEFLSETQAQNTSNIFILATNTPTCNTEVGVSLQTPIFTVEDPTHADLIYGATFQQYQEYQPYQGYQEYQESKTRKRRGKRINDRFGALIGNDHFVSTCLLLTLTFDDEALLSPARPETTDGRLTRIQAHLQRAGYQYRVTARESSLTTGRLHYHILVDLGPDGIAGLYDALLQTSRNFRKLVGAWVSTERTARFEHDYDSWVNRGRPRQRKGRSHQELLISAYVKQSWNQGHTDAVELPKDAGRGYVLKFRYQQPDAWFETSRISFSRPASAYWAHGAALLVYAHAGECFRYGPRDPEWAERQVQYLDRKAATRKRESENALRLQREAADWSHLSLDALEPLKLPDGLHPRIDLGLAVTPLQFSTSSI